MPPYETGQGDGWFEKCGYDCDCGDDSVGSIYFKQLLNQKSVVGDHVEDTLLT